MNKNLYWSPQKLLTYNRILNFVIGARGIGKSFAMKEYPINRFKKYGEQFVYVKRYKTDMKKVDNYFDDIIKEEKFPELDLKAKNHKFYINEQIAGWAIPLSTWQNEKSNAYPHVTTIIFDEFIRENDMSGYLPNEVESLLNLMDTIFRDRENVRCICLSNAVSLVNPYFLYFGLMPDTTKRYNAYKDIVVEIPDSTRFAEERQKTKFGSLIDGTNYAEMAVKNDFVNDTNVFVEKRSKTSKFQFMIVFKGLKMGIWVDVNAGLMYVSQDFDPSAKFVYAMTKDDLTENTLLMQSWRKNYHLKKMVTAFKNGFLRFDNQVIRNECYDMFNKMGVQ